MFTELSSKSNWTRNRDDYLTGARKCKEALTNPEGWWRYPPEHPEVTAAVGRWVARARDAHRIAMGRRPVIHKLLIADAQGVDRGAIYAK